MKNFPLNLCSSCHDNMEDVVMWRVFVCCVNRNAGKQEFQSCGDTLNSCINFNKTLQWSYYKWLGAIIKFSPFNLNLLLEYFSWAQNASALWWSIRASVKAEGTISVTISLVASFCSNEARLPHRGAHAPTAYVCVISILVSTYRQWDCRYIKGFVMIACIMRFPCLLHTHALNLLDSSITI